MTLFDVAVVGLLFVSILLALFRGLVREIIALAAWVVGVVVALVYAGDLARVFVGWKISPAVAQVLGFAALFVGVLIVGGIVGALLSRMIRAIGLGWLDRLLGGAFGFARGVAILIVLVLIAGITSLPRHDWWQDALLAPPLVAAALQFREWLPPAWAERLDFSAAGPPSGGSGMRVAVPLAVET